MSTYLFVGFIIVVILFFKALADKMEQSKIEDAALPYTKKTSILTPAEQGFYSVLRDAAANMYHICPKVRMADIIGIENTRDNRKYYQYFNRIQAKHVDFLLCDPQTLEPVLAIELDDSSHEKHSRQLRDRLVNAIFRNAQIPLVHIKTAHSYDMDSLLSQLEGALLGTNKNSQE